MVILQHKKIINNKNITTMKKFTTIFKTMLIALTGIITMSSCEDDAQEVAYTLEGSWSGYIDTFFQDHWTGDIAGDEYRVTFTFLRNGDYDYDSATSGYGYETGYNVNDRYHDCYQSRFYWQVDNTNGGPVITISYTDDPWNPVYIYDYRISGSRFSGYMNDGTNRSIEFDLYYDGNFNYNNWRRGSYSKTRSDGTDSVKVIENGKSFRSGIFAEIEPR